MLVPQLGGVQGQFHISRSRVLIVGAGGIGSTVILYLAGAGVGQIDVLDFDLIEESNLHRQIIHTHAGALEKQSKAESACERIRALNPQIQTSPLRQCVTSSNAEQLLAGYDVVVDATDNYDARYAISDACVALAIPLVSGSSGESISFCSAESFILVHLVGMEGQVTVFPCDRIAPCYRCLYPTPSAAESCRSCANAGLSPPPPLTHTHRRPWPRPWAHRDPAGGGDNQVAHLPVSRHRQQGQCRRRCRSFSLDRQTSLLRWLSWRIPHLLSSAQETSLLELWRDHRPSSFPRPLPTPRARLAAPLCRAPHFRLSIPFPPPDRLQTRPLRCALSPPVRDALPASGAVCPAPIRPLCFSFRYLHVSQPALPCSMPHLQSWSQSERRSNRSRQDSARGC
jgi:molybdopterin/thiamine biosynthesis adenylyltransferase